MGCKVAFHAGLPSRIPNRRGAVMCGLKNKSFRERAPMQRKVMISCAVPGSADSVGKTPAVPVTPHQIATSAIDAAKAGAAIVHTHVRDPKTGLENMEGGVYPDR